MSKQSEAKLAQGYQPKPQAIACMNCKNYKSNLNTVKGYYGEFTKESDIRCGIGDFAIKKMGTCNLFEAKEATK